MNTTLHSQAHACTLISDYLNRPAILKHQFLSNIVLSPFAPFWWIEVKHTSGKKTPVLCTLQKSVFKTTQTYTSRYWCKQKVLLLFLTVFETATHLFMLCVVSCKCCTFFHHQILFCAVNSVFVCPSKLRGNTSGPKTEAASATLFYTRRTRTQWMQSMCFQSS